MNKGETGKRILVLLIPRYLLPSRFFFRVRSIHPKPSLFLPSTQCFPSVTQGYLIPPPRKSSLIDIDPLFLNNHARHTNQHRQRHQTFPPTKSHRARRARKLRRRRHGRCPCHSRVRSGTATGTHAFGARTSSTRARTRACGQRRRRSRWRRGSRGRR